jgi:hypothetical protein
MSSPNPPKSALKKAKPVDDSKPKSIVFNERTSSSSGKHGKLEAPRKHMFTSDTSVYNWNDQTPYNINDPKKSPETLSDENEETIEFDKMKPYLRAALNTEARERQRDIGFVRPRTTPKKIRSYPRLPTLSKHSKGGRKTKKNGKTKKNQNSRKRVSKKNRR